MPLHRWMHSAAGGTSQRLKPAVAIVCSLSRIPNPPPVIVPAPAYVLILSSPAAALSRQVCLYDPVILSQSLPLRATLIAAGTTSTCAGRPSAFEAITPDMIGYAARRR